ncbi:FAD binding domain-containing protein [Gymnopilus junonius]|uniref:FAD binding domain-containing protein n=1 Tax=Gymnopilus junonius TaxID=109634 RepID=A0A9P5N7N7_GYMJU|nr:FAD binding domain-containing protein [Gymnopilus junonius]
MPANPEKTQVLVIGAGPTGLTMALYLAKHDINVRIIEQYPAEHGGARGTAILELLAIMGADKDLFEIATGPLQMAVYGTDGKTILKAFDWSEAAEDSPTIPFRRTASIGQAQLEAILHRHVKQFGCEIEFGKKLLDITQDGDKVTAKVLADGTEHLIDCDYLVAADGAKGRSRRLVGALFIGETKEADRLWTANVEVPGFSREYWHRWGDFSKAATSLKPINPAPLFHMQSLGPALPKDIPKDLNGTQELFNSIAGRDDIKIEKAEYISEWTANIRMSDKFAVGCMFLSGDVAHCHSPMGGQGTNTAMQDAFNLAWKLVLVLNKKTSVGLLASYEAERMPVVAEMLNLSTALHARVFPHIPATAFETPRPKDSEPDPMQCSKKLLQLGVNYRWSDIVFDERYNGQSTLEKNPYNVTDKRIRAGDRAPFIGNLVGEKITDLFTLLKEAPSHVVLIFPSSASSKLENLASIQGIIHAGLVQIAVIVEDRAPYADDTRSVKYLVDTTGKAREAYVSDTRTTYAIIRPDGIIGGYSFRVDGIVEYCSRLGVVI